MAMRTTENCTMGSMAPIVVISARGERRLDSGHPWIYRSDVVDAHAEPGQIVLVRGPRAQPLGHALYSSKSQITLRMLAYGEAPVDDGMIRARIESAIAYRSQLAPDATAYRLVHGEADLLPSLIVDKYADYLVVQTLSQGMDRLLPIVSAALAETVGPRGILAGNDAQARIVEGL